MAIAAITAKIKLGLAILLILSSVACSSSGDSASDNEAPTAATQTFPSQSRTFASDLESETAQCWETRLDSGGNWNFAGCGGLVNIGQGSTVALAENEASNSGTKSLRVTFVKDEDYGGAEVVFPGASHIFTRFYDYYDTDFDFAFGMKVHRIRSFDLARGLNNFDSTLVIVGAPQTGEFDYSGINEAQFLNFGANGGPTDWTAGMAAISLPRGRWTCVETEMKLNSPGRADGETRVWLDGSLVLEGRGLNIRGDTESEINTVLFGGWYSNSAAGNNPTPDPQATSLRYLDDVAVDTKRIGCLG